MFQTKVVKKITPHVSLSITVFPKILPFMSNMEKLFRAGQATDENMAHAHCMLHN